VSLTPCRSDSWVAILFVTVASITFLGCSTQRGGDGERDPQLSDVAPSSAADAGLRTADAAEGNDYDPCERFNEKTFWFNFDVMDRYALKPQRPFGRRLYRTRCARVWQMHLTTWRCRSGS
jgi:hypothetical protein